MKLPAYYVVAPAPRIHARGAQIFPAYGILLATADEARAHWQNGKDWRTPPWIPGTYCSIRDSKALREEGLTHVILRYGNRGILANREVWVALK